MQINLYKTPSEKAVIADASLISCDQNIQLNANAFANGLTGNWSSVDTSIRITSPNTASTTINNLRPGMNRLTWSLSSGACVNYSSDEITVYYETAPIANKDTFSISFNGSAILNVKRNDQVFSPEFDIEVLSAPKNGTATMNSDGNISYTAKQNFVGTDVFTYELCSPTCANECAVGTVELKIGDDAECMVPTIMTPNGDGINDAFSIPCMETGKYPNNEVIIFNQWGDEIYRAAPYKNDWQGTYDGADIPVGTYYYVISFGESIKPKAGFLIIER
jgi:gliding motility-associated-like protein